MLGRQRPLDALRSASTGANDSEAVDLVLDCLHAIKRRALANAMASISLGRPDLTPRLGLIPCPTVFVTGSDHSRWTPEQAESKRRLLATGSVVVVADTAYLAPLEAPKETIRIVRDLWSAAAVKPGRGADRADALKKFSIVRMAPGTGRM